MKESKLAKLLFFLLSMDSAGDRIAFLFRQALALLKINRASPEEAGRNARIRLQGLTIHYAPSSGELFGTYYDIFKKGMYSQHPEWVPAPHATIFDVGANIGLYSLFASRQAPGVSVFSFEPNPYAYEKLQENIAGNSCANVTLFNQAVGNKTGTTSFRVFPSSTTIGKVYNPAEQSENNSCLITVDMTTIDAVVAAHAIRKIDILKIDVEGFAAAVVEGAKNSLSIVEKIVLEVHNQEERNLEHLLSPHFVSVPSSIPEIMYLLRKR